MGRGAIAGGTEHLTVKHTVVLIGCHNGKLHTCRHTAFTSNHTHTEMHARILYINRICTCTYRFSHFICFKAGRAHCSQDTKRERMRVRERKKREKTGSVNAQGQLGAFPLALTGEINHCNYGPAQVNRDRSPLSFPSSRCFLLIRASQALLPADPWLVTEI